MSLHLPAACVALLLALAEGAGDVMADSSPAPRPSWRNWVQACTASSTSAPNLADAKRLLQARIAAQAEGRIRLVGFKSDEGAKPAPWDNDDEGRFLITYEAQIAFVEPCLWDTQFEGMPVTFKTFKPGTLQPITNRVFSITRKGEQFTLRGQIALKGSPNSWEATGFYWSDPPERNRNPAPRDN